MSLNLSFNHHDIQVECPEGTILDKLRDEFHYFINTKEVRPDSIITLSLNSPPTLPSMVAHKVLENAVIYHFGGIQYIDYFGEALTVLSEADKKVKIFAKNPQRLYELGFLAVHSILGEHLDLQGFCRLHAVGVSLFDTNVLIMLPSKGGKSTLLTGLLEDEEIKIISDDTPLIDRRGQVHPFPSKISLDQIPESGPLSQLNWQEFTRHYYPKKWTASLSQLSDRIATHTMENETLLIAGYRLSSGISILTPVTKWKMLHPLLEHMIIGFGLPQIMEMFLKFHWSDVFKLIYHGVIRIKVAMNLLRHSQCYHFYMGPDLASNNKMILDLLYEHKHS